MHTKSDSFSLNESQKSIQANTLLRRLSVIKDNKVNPMPNIATIMLDNDMQKVLSTQRLSKEKIAEELKLTQDQQASIHEKNIFSKILISKKGKVNMIMCDPLKKTQKIDQTNIVFEE